MKPWKFNYLHQIESCPVIFDIFKLINQPLIKIRVFHKFIHWSTVWVCSQISMNCNKVKAFNKTKGNTKAALWNLKSQPIWSKRSSKRTILHKPTNIMFIEVCFVEIRVTIPLSMKLHIYKPFPKSSSLKESLMVKKHKGIFKKSQVTKSWFRSHLTLSLRCAPLPPTLTL